MTGDAKLLEKLARQMVYLDRLIVEARRRGDFGHAQHLEEQRMQVQLERSALMRHQEVDEELRDS